MKLTWGMATGDFMTLGPQAARPSITYMVVFFKSTCNKGHPPLQGPSEVQPLQVLHLRGRGDSGRETGGPKLTLLTQRQSDSYLFTNKGH